MLEKIANRFQTAVLVLLVGLLSAVFVLQFGGPQAEGCTAGGSTYAARVDGETITVGEFNANYRLAGFQRQSPEQQRSDALWSAILNGLIERNLLASEAEKLGYQVEAAEIGRRFVDEQPRARLSFGHDSSFGTSRELAIIGPEEDEQFDREEFSMWVQNGLRRSVDEFVVAQQREELAQRMRDTVTSSVSISPQEVWLAYVREKDRAKIKFVRFSPAYYREELEPTDEELSGWMAENTEAVDQEYESNRHRYTDLEPQVRARHILIKAGEDAAEDIREAARSRAEGLLRQARGGADFEALATENSEDTGSARRGGDLGYNPRGRMVTEFDEAQFSMEIGDISDLVETRFGFHIIKVVGKREGDVPVDEAKRELADRLYRDARSSEMASHAATEALAKLKNGESMDELDAFLLRQEQGEEDPPAEPAQEAEDAPAEEEEPDRNPLAPQVRESRLFARTDNPIQGPFDSGPLVRDVFERNMDNPLPEEPMQLGSEYVIFQLTERSEATREDFEGDEKQRIERGLLEAKRREVLNAYISNLRETARREGRIRITAHELTVELDGPGEVKSDPDGIDCGRDCTANYEFGTMVQLTAETETGGRFLGWSGACSGRDETCVVQMTSVQNVVAKFRGGATAPTESESDEPNPEEEATTNEEQ